MKIKNLVLVLIFSLIALVPFAITSVTAQEICGLLPCNNSPIINGDVNAQASDFIRLAVSLIFIAIVLYGVVMIVQAGLKIIRSEGDSGKLEEGQRMVKGALIGLGLIFVGVIGLIIVFAFFDAGDIVNTNINVPDNVEVPLLTE